MELILLPLNIFSLYVCYELKYKLGMIINSLAILSIILSFILEYIEKVVIK